MRIRVTIDFLEVPFVNLKQVTKIYEGEWLSDLQKQVSEDFVKVAENTRIGENTIFGRIK